MHYLIVDEYLVSLTALNLAERLCEFVFFHKILFLLINDINHQNLIGSTKNNIWEKKKLSSYITTTDPIVFFVRFEIKNSLN